MEDAELVLAIRSGNEPAWQQLVERHSDFLFRLARTIVYDDGFATDAMQTAWLRLLESIDQLQNPAAVRSWLATTVRREAIALSKARQRTQPSDAFDWGVSVDRSGRSSVDADPGDLSAQSAQYVLVLSELYKLSDECQEILTLRAHKVPYSEIAVVLGMPVGSIGPKGQRCLEQLRRVPAIIELEATS